MPAPPIPSPDNNRPVAISILIPVYNAGTWVEQCVESALAQTYPAAEIIAVDDGSTDDSLARLKSFGGRIRVERGEHAGGNAARNQLLHLASGEWVQFLDADDYLLPNKLEIQAARAAAEPGLDLIYSPVILREEQDGSERLLPLSETDGFPLHFIHWGALNTNGFLWRRTSVLHAGGWNPDQPACQEHELLMRMIDQGAKSGLVNQPGAVYRFHQTGTVSRGNPLRTLRLQMELLDRMEAYLSRQSISAVHRNALFAARMQAARNAWKWDTASAEQFAARAKASGVRWVSPTGALPASFQLLQTLLGFGTTERIAASLRGPA